MEFGGLPFLHIVDEHDGTRRRTRHNENRGIRCTRSLCMEPAARGQHRQCENDEDLQTQLLFVSNGMTMDSLPGRWRSICCRAAGTRKFLCFSYVTAKAILTCISPLHGLILGSKIRS